MSINSDLFRTKAFLDEVGRIVFSVLKTRCPSLRQDDAEDISQDVLIKLIRATENGTKIDNIRSYVWRAAYTTALDVLAERGREGPIVQPESNSGLEGLMAEFSTEDVIERRVFKRWIVRMVETLPAARRRVFKLFLLGLSTKDIAVHLGWSHSKVRHLYYRGIEEMRKKSRRNEGGRQMMEVSYD
ncbi:MAG: RNA polymerase sigma factor [Candidatus Aminicenantes bacterium]|nr:RNA polymerase sigma factor [Candidatus Aminicenantes bacterium]